jgi:hypothetical protein
MGRSLHHAQSPTNGSEGLFAARKPYARALSQRKAGRKLNPLQK